MASLGILCRETQSQFMIPISPQPEPPNFNGSVREPGLAFLKHNPNPTSKEFSKHNYWKRISQELHNAYQRICAYTCFFIVDGGTVDHFLPKTTNPKLAYEWSNYRLSSPRVNNHKANEMDIVDPFNMDLGLFIIDFPSCLVKVNSGFSSELQEKAKKTITILRLNDDDHFVQTRCQMMLDYANNEVTIDFLRRRYPFLASEIIRQGIQVRAGEIFKTII